MKKLMLTTPLLLLLGATQSIATTTLVKAPTNEVEHGGGCRKDSPPGKCCHAGSKPYHCH
ncbi:hypothetical protein GR167_16780 [Rhodobacteraceae bacterium GS-10]|uniref:YHYH domain-containing protein n=1 Tax=Thalassovita mangrovi TaxID=2692236 RepID=A0A6L8LLW4_9RHOB|nr:hypothetical protein [Thalassovita mangrovi]